MLSAARNTAPVGVCWLWLLELSENLSPWCSLQRISSWLLARTALPRGVRWLWLRRLVKTCEFRKLLLLSVAAIGAGDWTTQVQARASHGQAQISLQYVSCMLT